MAAYGQPRDPRRVMAAVRPRTGFPVLNQGGMPQTPTVAPPKPFVTRPTVGAQPGPQRQALAAFPPPTDGGGGGIGPGFAPGAPAPGTTPAPPVPAAPTPAPTPAPPPPPSTSTSTSSSSGSSGQTGVLSPSAQGSLEAQLQEYIKQGLSGSTVSPAFIDRAKSAVSRNVWGQQRAGERAINDDAVRRGLFRSGIPAESIANLRAGSQGAIASGVADILNSAEAQNIQGKQAAAGTGTSLLGMNRDWEQYQNQRADAAAARAAAGRPQTFTYIDPDTGQSYELDEAWF